MNGQSPDDHFEPFVPSPSVADVVDAFVECLTVSSCAERDMMMSRLREMVCILCGAPDPDCDCWERDEAIPS